MGLRADISASAIEAAALFTEGMACYLARDWDAALEKFEASAQLEPNQPGVTPGVSTNPSLVYQRLVKKLKENPPAADWNGAYAMTEK